MCSRMYMHEQRLGGGLTRKHKKMPSSLKQAVRSRASMAFSVLRFIEAAFCSLFWKQSPLCRVEHACYCTS